MSSVEVSVEKITQDHFKTLIDEQNVPFTEAVMAEGKVPVTWSGTFKKDDIIHIQPNCGCTAEVTWEDGEIKAWYTADTVDKIRKRLPNVETQYPSGKVPVQKSLVVYLNDGEDLKVIGDRGFEVYNPNKAKFLIHFNGYVRYK